MGGLSQMPGLGPAHDMETDGQLHCPKEPAALFGNQKTQQRLTFLTGIPKIWENLPK